MLAVTNILRPPPTRVGKISDTIVLPRTVELKKLLAAAAGTFLGALLWTVPLGLIFGYTLTSLLICAGFGGFLGVLLVSWSPLRGESFATWLGLSSSTLRADRVRIDGLKVRAYLGVAPLNFTAAGATRLVPGAVDVPIGQVDERGVLLSPKEMFQSLASDVTVDPMQVAFEGFERAKRLTD